MKFIHLAAMHEPVQTKSAYLQETASDSDNGTSPRINKLSQYNP